MSRSAPDRRAASAADRRPPFAPEAKRALELAQRVATELHHQRILPAHLALALLRLENELVSRVLLANCVVVKSNSPSLAPATKACPKRALAASVSVVSKGLGGIRPCHTANIAAAHQGVADSQAARTIRSASAAVVSTLVWPDS